MSSLSTETLGSLVQDYVDVQCRAILELRTSIAAREEDAVHPARVAIRRLRATLRTFGGVYQRVDRESLAKELRWAGVLLGEVRDLQVLAERFGAADDSPPTVVQQLIAADIARERETAWQGVADGLGSARGAALFAQIERWRDDPPFGSKADRPAHRARRRVKKADAQVRARLRRTREAVDAGRRSASELLHDARKAAKRHRYAVELARPVLGAEADTTIKRREALQDALGEHQDAVVALAFLNGIDTSPQDRENTLSLDALIAATRERADDVDGVLREAERTS